MRLSPCTANSGDSWMGMPPSAAESPRAAASSEGAHQLRGGAPAVLRGIDVGPVGTGDVDPADPPAGLQPAALEPVELELAVERAGHRGQLLGRAQRQTGLHGVVLRKVLVDVDDRSVLAADERGVVDFAVGGA